MDASIVRSHSSIEENISLIDSNDEFYDYTSDNEPFQFLLERVVSQTDRQSISLDGAWRILRHKISKDPYLKTRFRLGRKACSIVLRFDSGERNTAENLIEYCFQDFSHLPEIETIEEREEHLEATFVPQEDGSGSCPGNKVGCGSKIKAISRAWADGLSKCTYYDTLVLADMVRYAGTLALIMPLENGELLGLTAAHSVLENWSRSNPTTHRYSYSDQHILSEIKYGSASYSNMPSRQIHCITRGFNGGFENYDSSFMDVAKFEVTCPWQSVLLNISGGDCPITICIGKLVGTWVHKRGAVTGTTCGQVIEEDCDWCMTVDGHRQNLPGVFYVQGSDGQMFAEEGDSGSAVYDLAGRVYGMVIGRKKRHVITAGEPCEPVSVCIRMDKMLQYVFQQRPHSCLNEQDERPAGGGGAAVHICAEESRSIALRIEKQPNALNEDTRLDRLSTLLSVLDTYMQRRVGLSEVKVKPSINPKRIKEAQLSEDIVTVKKRKPGKHTPKTDSRDVGEMSQDDVEKYVQEGLGLTRARHKRGDEKLKKTFPRYEEMMDDWWPKPILIEERKKRQKRLLWEIDTLKLFETTETMQDALGHAAALTETIARPEEGSDLKESEKTEGHMDDETGKLTSAEEGKREKEDSHDRGKFSIELQETTGIIQITSNTQKWHGHAAALTETIARPEEGFDLKESEKTERHMDDETPKLTSTEERKREMEDSHASGKFSIEPLEESAKEFAQLFKLVEAPTEVPITPFIDTEQVAFGKELLRDLRSTVEEVSELQQRKRDETKPKDT